MASETAVPGSDARRRGSYAKTPQRRREIVEAAADVFADRGYSGGSLRQVAKDIGVSVTSVMHHFPSKEVLLEAVLEHADAEAAREIDLDAGRDGLRGTVVRLARTGQDHPNLLRLLAVLSAEASAAEHPAHDWFVERYRRVEDTVSGWAEADRIGDLDPAGTRVLARRVIALWDGLQLQWLLRRDFDLVAELDAGVAALVEQARRTEPAR
jgi:AcrR family transcriptional regulator